MKQAPKSSKLIVLDPQENTPVPFLRGILTRSLQDAGLNLEEAYQVATKVRKTLSDRPEITTRELALFVAEFLKTQGFEEVAHRYANAVPPDVLLRVIDRSGQSVPFSRAQLAQSLEICAITPAQRFDVGLQVERHLRLEGRTEVPSTEVARLTHRYLAEHTDAASARRYAYWIQFSRSGRPLILLVGGTTGCGKSSISSEIAHRLNIVRTQSTDMLREVMRLMVPVRLLPTLHTSSFTAWRALHYSEEELAAPTETHLIDGYLTQAGQVAVGIEGVLQRAEKEQISMIMEGVHLHPVLQRRLAAKSRALVVPFLLAVLKRKHLRKQLVGRGQLVTSRRSERYLKHFESIWQLQTFLLSEADRCQIPIISNDDREVTMRLVMDSIADALEKAYQNHHEGMFK
jgi:2-phosphoglycerate kinase